ncbi:MAG TPA: Crp/Fnr family transcriptional regulator [Pyrinomonadaceae bacterium]|nr:Crp/Fnr family transcriptional regulator [Pyrinomonadaceae bacterium]
MRPVLGDQETELVRLIRSSGRKRHFGADELIFSEGESADNLPVVISGRVKMVHFLEPGKEVIIGIFDRGEMFAVPPVFDGKSYPSAAIAMEPTELLLIPRKRFLELIKASPDFALAVIEWMCAMLREKTMTIQNLATASPDHRVAKVLLKLSEREGGRFPVRIGLRRQDIAEMAGVTTETAIRVIRRFAERGLVRIDRGKVVLYSAEELAGITD